MVLNLYFTYLLLMFAAILPPYFATLVRPLLHFRDFMTKFAVYFPPVMDNTNKKYYKISEVSEITGLPMSTLRFWESQFPAINPRRNDRGTRFYTPRDIETIRMVSYLVKDKGMKLEAAQEEMKRNRDGVAKRFEAIEGLRNVRNRLQELIDSLHHLR